MEYLHTPAAVVMNDGGGGLMAISYEGGGSLPNLGIYAGKSRHKRQSIQNYWQKSWKIGGEINFAKIRKGMQTNVKLCKIIQTCKYNLPNNVIFGDSPAVQK